MAVLDNTITTGDVAPAISIDLIENLATNIRSLQELLGVVDLIPVTVGSQIKRYTETVGTLNKQTEEGDIIPLSEVLQEEADPIVVTFDLYRKMTTAQAIQQSGRQRAIYDTDRALIGEIRKAIKSNFYDALADGSGTIADGDTLQEALANAWGELSVYFEDYDVSPIYFINPKDVAKYLGKAQITIQTAFGFDYVENFLGLGTAIFSPNVEEGTFFATAKENLRGAVVPANGEVGQEFDLTSDETGTVGITHGRALHRGSIETMLLCGVMFFAENLAGVFKGTIGGGAVSA